MDCPPAGLTGTVAEYWPPHDYQAGLWVTERAEAVCAVWPDEPQPGISCGQVLCPHVRGLRLLEVTDSRARKGACRNGSMNH
jgi:hypothetical protein